MAVETKKRSFKQIREKEDFFNFCKKIAEEYANSSNEFARSYFTKEYDITVSCFYKILEVSVIWNIVSDKTVTKMEAKAIENQKKHYEEAGVTTKIHYSQLRRKRKEYIDSFTSEYIEELLETFARNPDISKKEIATMHGISTTILDLLIEKGIMDLIVDDEIFSLIRERSLNNAPYKEKKEVSEKYFEYLLQERNSKLPKF